MTSESKNVDYEDLIYSFKEGINVTDTPFISSDVDEESHIDDTVYIEVIRDVIKANKAAQQLIESQEDLAEKIQGLKVMKRISDAIKKKEFNWQIITSDECSDMRTPIQFRSLTVKKESKHNCYLLSNPGFYLKYYPLELIERVSLAGFYLSGTPTYDQVLRIQCDLVQILLVFHLKRDTRYLKKIDAKKFNVIEPLSRIHIRRNNLNNKELSSKYITGGFNIKTFVFKLFDIFFQNVSWRYIGAEHIMHQLTFGIIEYMFRVGMWEYEDIPSLLRYLQDKAENMLNLENACRIELPKLSNAFGLNVIQLFRDIKDSISSILLHIIILINDTSMARSLTAIPGDVHNRKPWRGAYFNSHNLNNIINQILTRYIMVDKKLESQDGTEMSTNTYELSETLEKIFLLISDTQQDVTSLTMELTQPKEIEYYLLNYPGKESIVNEAVRISKLGQALIDDIANGKISDLISNDDYVLNLEKPQLMMEKIVAFFKELEDSMQKRIASKELYYLQMALGDNGLILIVITLIDFLGIFKLTKLNDALKVNPVIFGISQVTLLCKDNYINQAMLFQENCGDLFYKISKRHPFALVLLLTSIFKTDQRILYVGRDILGLIFENYEKNLISFFGTIFSLETIFPGESNQAKFSPNESHAIKMNEMMSLFTYNSFILEVISKRESNQFKSKSYDLEIQDLVVSYIADNILPLLASKNNWIIDGKYGVYSNLNFEKTILNEKLYLDFLGEGEENFINLLNNNVISKQQILTYMFELCYSFIKILNSMSKRLVFEGSIDKIANKLDNFNQYSYLMEFDAGIGMVSELIQLYRTYLIFPNDMKLGEKRTSTSAYGTIHSEELIPDDMQNDSVVLHIETIIGFIKNKSSLFELDGEDDSAKLYVRSILFEGLYPTAYKYIKGVTSIFVPNIKQNNIRQLTALLDNINAILGLLTSNVDTLSLVSGGLFYGTETLKQYKGPKADKLEEMDNLEEDELLYPNLYNLRLTGDILLYIIEKSMPSKLLGLISDFSLPRSNETLEKQFFRYIIEESDKIPDRRTIKSIANIAEKSLRQDYNAIEMKLKLGNKAIIIHKQYVQLKDTYLKEKLTWLNLVGNENILINFLKLNEETLENIVVYCLSSIHDNLVSRNKAINNDNDAVLKAFFKNDFILSYIKFMSKLSGGFPEFKDTFFKMLTDNESENKKNTQMAQNVIGIIYCLMIIMRQFHLFKIFPNRHSEDIYELFNTLSDYIKNCCENNFLEFKEFFSSYKPVIKHNETQIFTNISKRDVFFDFYVRLEASYVTSLFYSKKDTHITMNDRSELFKLHVRDFQIISEFVNGPCVLNQRRIFRYRGDIFIGILTRIIDDIDSSLYDMKLACLDYILALIEGEGDPVPPKVLEKLFEDIKDSEEREIQIENFKKHEITDYFASNLTPKLLYEILYKLLKRLAMNITFKQYPSVKRSLMKKLAAKKIETIRNANNNKISIEDQKYIVDRYEKGLDIHGKPIPNNKIITSELLELYPFEDYEDLISMYINRSEFVSHPITKICMKIYSLLEILGKRNGSFNNYILEKKITLHKIYGEKVDQDDRATQLIDDREKATVKPQITEDLVFFMFILKISRQVEIWVGKSNKTQKIVYYPRMPETFYLEDNVKEKFIDKVDLENKKADFIRYKDYFFLEMENNYRVSIISHTIYQLTCSDSFENMKLFLWYSGLAINCVCLYSYELLDNQVMGDRRLEAGDYQYGITIASSIFAFISFFIFFFWLIFRYPFEIIAKFKFTEIQDGLLKHELRSLKTIAKVVVYEAFLRRKSPLSFFLHFCFAIMGIFLNPFFHSLHLILIVNISKTAEYVVKASFVHIDQLMMTLIFAFFMIYSFSTLNASFFSDSFQDGEDTCTSLRACFVFMINLGLRNGGGIADAQELYGFYDKKFPYKTIFDLSFFIFVNIVSLNIIFGIIIDTFAEMRDAIIERSKLSIILFR